MEIIQAYLFDRLSKLETLDLSLNRIRVLQEFSFKELINLRNLHLNENDDQNFLIESNRTFTRFDTIQTIYVSKHILNRDAIINVFLQLFNEKKKQLNKTVLRRAYFKSLFLMSNYDSSECDCNLTLFFMRHNIHFNFKTERQIFDYFSNCNFYRLNVSSLQHGSFVLPDNNMHIFANCLPYFFWSYLALVLFFGIYLLFKFKQD